MKYSAASGAGASELTELMFRIKCLQNRMDVGSDQREHIHQVNNLNTKTLQEQPLLRTFVYIHFPSYRCLHVTCDCDPREHELCLGTSTCEQRINGRKVGRIKSAFVTILR